MSSLHKNNVRQAPCSPQKRPDMSLPRKQEHRSLEVRPPGSNEGKTGAEINTEKDFSVSELKDSGLSPYCQFDKLDRAGAERLLKDKNKDGMYMVRNGLEGLRVLSVWAEGSCNHYMIYTNQQDGGVFLVKQKIFNNLQELLHYYTEAYLPRLKSSLCHPYRPDNGMIPTLARSYGMHTSHESSLKETGDRPMNFGEFPRLRRGSAPELLGKCRYSGWIRKQGGSHKNWKHRYLILRTGCLYYFTNETASSPKGQFALTGYRVAECSEPKKFTHMFKLDPGNPLARTYIFACSASHELERWKFELEDEIKKIIQLKPPHLFKSPSMPSPSIDLSKPQSPLLPHRTAQTPTNTSTRYLTASPVASRHKTLARTNSDPGHVCRDDDPCDSDSSTEITDSIGSLDFLSYVDTEALLPVDKHCTSVMDEKPAVLRDSRSSTTSISSQTTQDDNEYLTVVDAISSSVTQLLVTEKEQKPLQQQSPILVDSTTNQVSLVSASSCDDDDYYYIAFPTPEEALPPSCMFGKLNRTDAERMLRNKDEEGTYLIRDGSAKSGSDKVLTVWHNGESRHYKLFINNESYSLSQEDKLFNSLPALIQYYHLQSFLPKSDFYLRIPYK